MSGPVELVEGIRIFHDLREDHPRPPWRFESTSSRDDTVWDVPSVKEILELGDTREPDDGVDPEVRYGRRPVGAVEDTQAFLTYQQQIAYQPEQPRPDPSAPSARFSKIDTHRARQADIGRQERHAVNTERLRRLRVDDIMRAVGLR